MTQGYLREACVSTIEEAVAAERLGADRLEFCAHLEVDGLTPDYDEVKILLKSVEIPVVVIIRPRAGNFEYTDLEFEQMKKDIIRFKSLGIKGIVLGILQGQSIDVERTKILAELASPLDVCFHKAIDDVEDPIFAIEQLNTIPEITRVLSSGTKATVEEGLDILKKMVSAARKDLSIMPGGKVKGSNIDLIHKNLQVQEYHGRSILMNY